MSVPVKRPDELHREGFKGCATCGKFTFKTITWGDCMALVGKATDAPSVIHMAPIYLQGTQHHMNGRNCPHYLPRWAPFNPAE